MKLFYCYSPKLKNELNNLGYKWCNVGKHKTTKKIFWVYNIDLKLKQYLINRRNSNK